MAASARVLQTFLSEPITVASTKTLLDVQSLYAFLDEVSFPKTFPSRLALILEVLDKLLSLPENLNSLLRDKLLLSVLMEGTHVVGLTRILASQLKSIVTASLTRSSADDISMSNAVLIRKSDLWTKALPLLLNSEDTSVGETAATAIKQSLIWDKVAAGLDPVPAELSSVPTFKEILISEDFLKHLMILLDAPKANDSQKIRVLGMCVELGKQSPEVFAAFKDRGIYKVLFTIYNSEDVLLMLNCAELAIHLCSYPCGLQYTAEVGGAARLVKDLGDESTEDCLRVGLLDATTQLLELMSVEARKIAFSESDCQLMFTVTLDYLSAKADTTKLLCGLASWGRLTASLLNWAPPAALADAAGAIGHPSDAQVSVAAMQAWTRVVHTLTAAEGQWTEAVQSAVGDAIAKQVTAQVIGIHSRPFEEQRPQMFALLKELCKERRFIEPVVLSSAKGLLTKVNSETQHDAVLAKHEFIVELMRQTANDNPSWLEEALGVEALSKLKQYAKSPNAYTQVDAGVPQVEHIGA